MTRNRMGSEVGEGEHYQNLCFVESNGIRKRRGSSDCIQIRSSKFRHLSALNSVRAIVIMGTIMSIVWTIIYFGCLVFKKDMALNKYQEDTLTSTGSEFHVFYQVYSGNDKDVDRLRHVFNEQVAALRYDGTLEEASEIHITAIGLVWRRLRSTVEPNFSSDTEEIIPELDVAGSKFSFLGGYDKGWEDITLEHIRSHCVSRPHDIVMYMHTKGLYHSWPWNNKFRQNVMRGTASQCCLENLKLNKANVCGMRFCPEPHFHFPGNMFMARCDYIRELYPPKHFKAVRDAIWHKMHMSRASEAENAAGRYSMEHWVGSHPSLRALDTLPSGKDAKDWYCAGGDEFRLSMLPKFDEWEPQCRIAPRSGKGVVPFTSNFFQADVLPSERIAEYIATYGQDAKNRVERMEYGYQLTESDMDNYKQDAENTNMQCANAACIYFNRGSDMISDVQQEAFQGATIDWMLEWYKTKHILGCTANYADSDRAGGCNSL